MSEKHSIKWKWIKGHSNDPGNEIADELAKQGCRGLNRNTREQWGDNTVLNVTETLGAAMNQNTTTHTTATDFVEAMKRAAKEVYGTREKQPRKPWITNKTLELIDKGQQHRNRREFREEWETTKLVKKQARKDRKQWIQEQLEEKSKGDPREQWQGVKSLKKPMAFRNTQLEYKGKLVPIFERAEAFAQHLTEQQWGVNTQEQDHRQELEQGEVINTDIQIEEGEFTTQEFDDAIESLKKGKAHGTDELDNEMMILLDEINRQTLRSHINTAWREKKVPEKWKEAYVVEIFKKGDAKNPANYRRISLLSTAYKLLMRLMQIRLAENVDHLISNRQWGFRKGRSTGAPIHILRRVQEIFESTTSPLYLLFLDWKQAFDKLTHSGLHHALRRFGLPKTYLDMIDECYTGPTFQVKDQDRKSKLHPQNTGIRQGCPLSPYLFIIFMSVLMYDVHKDVEEKYGRIPHTHM